ncbi:hypothetical protein SDRG_01198 [Saprolegnia diclina VS20]|uniref:Uncharacterized protein n=1 Tax=Saprolegnia diclina (strain VS20) TaxID=1156394 RepID=T0S7T3_SAPDV|nr:hypothetical protein SDRG_01198 [Saprolegnia diclina VS20]EQC41223.1 hypothetical protein SDRG_01198 [Saprolegnia diclina VS20]|eukprot:XP_008604937.1 hypothetical protein SDRG_01198 [Saprolegnia diclina VS20]
MEMRGQAMKTVMLLQALAIVCAQTVTEHDGLLQNTNAMNVAKAEQAARDAARDEENVSLLLGSGVIFVAGVAMLGIIAYIVYTQHKRNVARDEDNQLMKSLLDSEMDYAAM